MEPVEPRTTTRRGGIAALIKIHYTRIPAPFRSGSHTRQGRSLSGDPKTQRFLGSF